MGNTHIPNKAETIGLITLWVNDMLEEADHAWTVFQSLKIRADYYEILNDMIELKENIEALSQKIIAMNFPKNIETNLIKGFEVYNEIIEWIEDEEPDEDDALPWSTEGRFPKDD